MSEIETSPDTAADSADVSVESSDSVESSPDLSAETSPEVSATSDEVGTLPEEPIDSVFDHENWDGNIDGLPDTLREPVRFLHRQLEGGYTKKFQTLAEERRRFDANRQEWDEKYGSWKDEKEAMNDELALLRNLLDGMEDPRVKEFQENNSSLKQNLADLQSEYENYKAIVEQDIQEYMLM